MLCTSIRAKWDRRDHRKSAATSNSLAGTDGCRAGWVVVRENIRGSISCEVLPLSQPVCRTVASRPADPRPSYRPSGSWAKNLRPRGAPAPGTASCQFGLCGSDSPRSRHGLIRSLVACQTQHGVPNAFTLGTCLLPAQSRKVIRVSQPQAHTRPRRRSRRTRTGKPGFDNARRPVPCA